MARLVGVDIKTEDFDNELGREAIRRIVMAGAAVCVRETQKDIKAYHHIGKTGSMYGSVRAGNYKENLGGGEIAVYPQDEDSRGVSNAVKAFVIDRGIGRRPNTARSHGKVANKTGDHFLTRKTRGKTEMLTTYAMEAEYDRIIMELNK